MDFSTFVVGGRKVRGTELVLALKVSIPSYSDYPKFVEDNQSRVAEPEERKPPKRGDRDGTQEIPDCDVVLAFFDPPGQSRSCFTIGRDPRCCDIVCANRTVSNQHIKFVFESDHLVLYNVSTLGSMLTVRGCQPQKTNPKAGVPYKCFLPPGCRVTLEIPGYIFTFQVVLRSGPELDEFRRTRDAFLATCCDLGALSLASQIPTQLASASLRAPEHEEQKYLYWSESKLGRGAYGAVRRVRRLQDWAVFAAKHVLESNESGTTQFDKRRRSLKREMATLQSLKHERIVEYVDWFEDASGCWNLVMECCHHGNLEQMIRAAATPFQPHQAAQILKQAAQGLRYLHEQGVTHRDLKPSNILVRSRAPLSLALCDFGIAKRALDDDGMMKTLIGTTPYMAPEIWMSGGYTKEVDIWALGVVGLKLVLRGLPKPKKTDPPALYPKLLVATAQARRRNAPEDEFVAVVTRLLVFDPGRRPDAAECIEHADDVLGTPHSSQSNCLWGRVWLPDTIRVYLGTPVG